MTSSQDAFDSAAPASHHASSGPRPEPVYDPAIVSPPPAASAPAAYSEAATDASATAEADSGMLDLEAVQRALNRSRASIYRYANTDPVEVNPSFNPKRLNPEYRKDPREALMFHPNEVARFAQDVLKIKQVTVEVLSSPHTATQNLLEAMLAEMRAIRQLLETGQANLPAQTGDRPSTGSFPPSSQE